jgi:glycosyltransferase involved in cell wall biosynthesis
MRVLFDHGLPFSLAHGGFQMQIEQTKSSLEQIGVEVTYLRWWDDQQTGDIIHYFGRPSAGYIHLAQQKGLRVVMSELMGGLAARPPALRTVQRLLMTAAKTALPKPFIERLAWESYLLADAIISLTNWEAELAKEMFYAPRSRVHVVPNGVESEFLETNGGNPPSERNKWLVCTATITERKRVVALARAAANAEVPVWVIGKPYSTDDPYHALFLRAIAESKGVVRYDGPVSNRQELASIYANARGFVLLSTMESLSLSALEAAACGCPLLLSDQQWARSSFGNKVAYCPVGNSESASGAKLREFYEKAPMLKPPPRPQSWPEVATMLKDIYASVLR